MTRRKPESAEQRDHRMACEALDRIDFTDLLAGLDVLEAERADMANRAAVARRVLDEVAALPVTLAGVVEFRQAINRVIALGDPLDAARGALMTIMAASVGWSAAQASKARHADRSSKGGASRPRELNKQGRDELRAFYAQTEAKLRAAGKSRGWVVETAKQFSVSPNTVRAIVNSTD
jgi:hypothetical protein